MLGKKGDSLAENVPSIVIAVLIIVIILGFCGYFIYIFFFDTEANNAKNVAGSIEGKVNAIKEGDTMPFFVQAFKGSENWLIAGWGNNDYERPDKCELKSCICVCKGSNEDSAATIAASCQKAGFCKYFDVTSISVEGWEVKVDLSNVVSNPTAGSVGTDVASLPFIMLTKQGVQAEASKTANLIEIKQI
jgi:hypothetical protein